MSELMSQMSAALRARHYSHRTEQAYCLWVRRFIRFHGVRHPADMAEPEINAFLTHLAVNEQVSASTQNQALSAVLFLYRNVLGRQVGELGGVIRARRERHLPVVLTRDEVKAVLAELDGDAWLMASLMYGAGLRLTECLRLRVQDIDFSRAEITVRDGKGGKDRVTMLPAYAQGATSDASADGQADPRARSSGRLGQACDCPTALERKYPSAAGRLALAVGLPAGKAMEERHDRRAGPPSRPRDDRPAGDEGGRVPSPASPSTPAATPCAIRSPPTLLEAGYDIRTSRNCSGTRP